LIAIFLGLPVGGGIAEVALRTIKGNRTRNTVNFATGATAIGVLLSGVMYYVYDYNNSRADWIELFGEQYVNEFFPTLTTWVTESITNNLGFVIFLGIVTFAVYSRFRM
jgi:hypothetical protein